MRQTDERGRLGGDGVEPSSEDDVDNVAIASALFDAMRHGDRAGVLALVHDDVRWRPTEYSGGGERRGKEGMAAWVDEYGGALENLDFQLASVEQVGPYVVLQGWIRSGTGADRFETELGIVFEIRDRKMIEGRAFTSWGEAQGAAGA